MITKLFSKYWSKMIMDAAIRKASAPTYRGPTPPNIGRVKRKALLKAETN